MINVAILGYGTVGSGVFEVLRTNEDIIARRTGRRLHVKYVLDLRTFPGDPVEEVLVHDYEQIVSDPQVDIVAEVMGGLEPAHTFVKRALESGKNVCTSNKALVAKFGPELMETARENHVNFLFEASCGGGIPIIRAINESLTADVIDEVTGILNGTTNYMLYRMDQDGASFDDVLKEAQQMGYAEADPSADVDGHDACRKIAILSSLAYGKFIDFEKLPVTGIRDLTPEDTEYARRLGCVIKLLGTSRLLPDGRCYALTAPFMVGSDSPLYGVHNVFNAVFIHGNMLGDAMFYGSGAGKLPTASAVAGDIIEAARSLHETIPNNWSNEEMTLMDPGEVCCRYFIRFKDNEGVREEALRTFGPGAKEVDVAGIDGEFGLVSARMSLNEYNEKAEKFSGAIICMIRMKD